ncbi:hypothetical protein HD806DRAFT_433902 [Xylariaceae sp. AK1471]|nr:hypothetical protein HD806DRAFT_433902 [Xylariaceae sp. AK1471]
MEEHATSSSPLPKTRLFTDAGYMSLGLSGCCSSLSPSNSAHQHTSRSYLIASALSRHNRRGWFAWRPRDLGGHRQHIDQRHADSRGNGKLSTLRPIGNT